jgi:hypothetical protein
MALCETVIVISYHLVILMFTEFKLTQILHYILIASERLYCFKSKTVSVCYRRPTAFIFQFGNNAKYSCTSTKLCEEKR